MRLKNYLAASMTEAMNQVKEELGPATMTFPSTKVVRMQSSFPSKRLTGNSKSLPRWKNAKTLILMLPMN